MHDTMALYTIPLIIIMSLLPHLLKNQTSFHINFSSLNQSWSCIAIEMSGNSLYVSKLHALLHSISATGEELSTHKTGAVCLHSDRARGSVCIHVIMAHVVCFQVLQLLYHIIPVLWTGSWTDMEP